MDDPIEYFFKKPNVNQILKMWWDVNLAKFRCKFSKRWDVNLVNLVKMEAYSKTNHSKVFFMDLHTQEHLP